MKREEYIISYFHDASATYQFDVIEADGYVFKKLHWNWAEKD